MYWWQRLILIVLMLVTSVLIALPANSFMLNDYGDPKEARWEGSANESNQGESEEEKAPTAIVTFNEWDSFIGHLWLIIPSIFILGVSYCVCLGNWCERHHLDGDDWIIATIVLQLVLLLGSISLVLVNNFYFEVPARLAGATSDENLAEMAISAYRVRQLLIPCITFVCFLVSDIVILLGVTGIVEGWTRLHKAFEAYKQNLVGVLLGDSRSLTLRPNGTVERAQYAYRLRWLPFPAVVPERVVTGTLPWPEVCKLLAHGVSTSAMEALCRQFKISLIDLFDVIGTKTSGAIVSVIGDKVAQRMNGQLVNTVMHNQAESLLEATDLLQSTSDKTLSQFQQELLSKVGDVVEAHLNDFRQNAIQFMQLKAAGNSTFIPYDGSAFPPGTRYCLSKGNATVFVVEEQPQTRTVMFSEGFRVRRNRILNQDTSFHLSFPYVVFVVKLVNRRFDTLCVCYSKRPLRNLSDRLCWPNLPNIHASGAVCLRLPMSSNQNDAAQEVQEVISNFWQSTFNNDYHQYHYDQPNPVKDVDDWAKMSKADPAFVLTADWRERDEPIQMLIEALLSDGKEDEIARAERWVHQSLSTAMKSLTAVVKASCQDIPVKKRYSKVLAKKLSDHLQLLGTTVLECMVAQLNEAVADTNGNVRHQYDFHLQREVNRAVAQKFFGEAVAALLEQQRLPDSIYQALDERRA